MRKPKSYWTKERCAEEALKYSSRNELAKKSSATYNFSIRRGWLDEICVHMPKIAKRKSNIKY